jgi:hypothetical protein
MIQIGLRRLAVAQDRARGICANRNGRERCDGEQARDERAAGALLQGASAVKLPFLSYSAKHHLKRRVRGTDWLFIAALIGIVAMVLAAMRFL